MRSRRPRHRYRRRRGSTALGIIVLAVAVAVGAFVIVTHAGGGGSGSAATAAPAAGSSATRAPLGPLAAPRRHGGALSGTAQVDAREVDQALRSARFVAAGSTRRRAIALTFDDGPGPYTPAILRILLRMHAPATFFVVGQELHDFAGALRAEVRHGFVIGDHTQNHAWLPRLGGAAERAQITDVVSELRRHGAPAPRLFRPPYGAFSARTMSALRRLRMFMVLWSIDPGDWRRPGTGAIVANVLANSRPGAIVILHDGGGDRSQTVAALPAIINGLRRRHYGLVTVPRLLALDPPPRHQRLPRIGGA